MHLPNLPGERGLLQWWQRSCRFLLLLSRSVKGCLWTIFLIFISLNFSLFCVFLASSLFLLQVHLTLCFPVPSLFLQAKQRKSFLLLSLFFFFSVQCLTHPLYQSPNTWLLLVWLDSFFETSNMHNDRIYASFSVLILVKIFCKLGLSSLYYKTWSVGDPIIRRKWTKSVHFRYSKNFCFKYQTWHVSLRFPLSSFWRCTISNF